MKGKKRSSPPDWPRKFLRWYCKPELLEEIEGDLEEEFAGRNEASQTKAKWIYTLQVITFLRPFVIKNLTHFFAGFYPPLFYHYSRTSFRAMMRQKLISSINILSLSLGIAIAILIYLFIHNELTFDTFHGYSDRIHRISRITYNAEAKVVDGIEGHPMAFTEAARDLVPEIEAITGIYDDEYYIRTRDLISNERVIAIEPDFFRMFDFEVIHGNPEADFSNPHNTVITEQVALNHFGKLNVVGETIELHSNDQYKPFIISAVVSNTPANSSLQFDMLVPIDFLKSTDIGRRYGEGWNVSFVRAFALLREDAKADLVEEKLKSLADLHFTDRSHLYEVYGKGSYYGYQLQALQEMHFDRELPSDLHEPGDLRSLKILGGIGILILLLGCMNFSILSIGRASNRIAEINTRKAIGAQRSQIIHQFLGESMLLAVFSTGIGLILAVLFVKEFGHLANRNLDILSLFRPDALAFLWGIALGSGMIAGIYPAIYLARIPSLVKLRTAGKFGRENVFTALMISIQFVMCCVLVFLTLTMSEQLSFLKSRDLGFDDELLLVIQRNGADRNDFFSAFTEQMDSDPHIVSMSATAPAISHGSFRSEFIFEGKEIPYQIFFVESNYLEIMEMELESGRFFDGKLASDSTESIVVNQSFVRALGWPDPIGKKVTGLKNAGYDEPVIIGVVNDFNFRSLEYEIQPVWMALSGKSSMDDLLVRIYPHDVNQTIKSLEQHWNSLDTGVPLSYSFLDEDMASLYASHERWARIVQIAGYVCMAIAYIGMFGLVALSLVSKTREISIRKVLGARLLDLWYVISSKYVKILIFSMAIAIPVAWYMSVRWLKNFAFHIDLNLGFIFATVAILLTIFLITISFHLISSMYINPVESLRSQTD